ncbi:GntR family transcriptional regulator [Zhouia spongiae]|uniref:GntR family transcriptional regulator n=1 Tax=Zhouia spongiae TaxID=2202721 RepID=A0ABY3YIZ7_9FLAO|nr:GntR family transcriptional regulator [Zhouia spongiae]UNY97831.1 GntR family transcriptional regulator [Zhouia spongiae]
MKPKLVKYIDHSSEVPLHKQIEKVLRMLINTGDYDLGRLLPSEIELSNMFGVSRSTVRQAFNTLVNEGLLERKRGKGTVVAQNGNIITQLNEWISFSKEMKRKGIRIKNYEVRFQEVECDEELAKVFEVPVGKKVKKLTRVKGDESVPFVKFESWFHPRIPISDNHDFLKPLNDILEEAYSIIPMRSSEEVQAIQANDELAEVLQVKKGMPLLYRKRIVYDAGMRIIEYNKCYYRHDKMKYKIDIVRSV